MGPDAFKVNELLDVIVKRAPELHAAGITSLSVPGLSITLTPPPAPDEQFVDPPPASGEPHIDPMQDPSTFVRGRVPGFTRPKEDR